MSVLALLPAESRGRLPPVCAWSLVRFWPVEKLVASSVKENGVELPAATADLLVDADPNNGVDVDDVVPLPEAKNRKGS